MRSRSGALHCETQEELLQVSKLFIQLAQTCHINVYYKDQPLHEDTGSQIIEGFRQIKNFQNSSKQTFEYIQEQNQSNQEQKQLNKGKIYLSCCFVDKEYIKCSIQIAFLTGKVQQTINKLLHKQSLQILFCHTKEQAHNCLYSHSLVSFEKNSNVVDLYTFENETVKKQSKRISKKLSLNGWIKESKQQKMMDLIIVNKHVSIKDANDLDHKSIILKYKIWVINPKFFQSNALLQIYKQKSHFIVQVDDKSGKFYQSSIEKDCKIYDKRSDQLLQYEKSNESETCKFKNVFHNIQATVAKRYIRSLKEILIAQKIKLKLIQKKGQDSKGLWRDQSKK